MKKIIYLLFVLPLLAILNSCDSDDPLIFDHELPQFEIKANAILLEVIMPQGSLTTDSYYIVGDFNGGMEEAVDNPEWQLEKSTANDLKWGIYLLPSSFKDGKTLADGFTFYSKKQGPERSVFNEEVIHTLNVGVGTRTNVWVNRWESYFTGGKKEFYTIYIDNQSGWDELALHYWGTNDSEGVVGTDWPGLQPTGTETISGVDFIYFELPKELNDKTINTILNNNGMGNQFDALFGFKVDRDVYIRITNNSFEEIDPEYNGYYIYVDNQTTWDELALYTWGDMETPPGWPGLQPTGTKEINGVNYTYFKMGEDFNGKAVNVIFNNNGNDKQLGDIPITLTRDFYFQITDTGSKEVDPFSGSEPGPDPGTKWNIYVEDNSGWAAIGMHYYGPAESQWPGIAPEDTKEIDGVTYTRFEMPEELDGKAMNFILNDTKDEERVADTHITLDRDYYFRITSSDIEEIVFSIYVDNQTGWDRLALYAWGEIEPAGWPGLQPTGTKEINGVVYTYFTMPANVVGKNINPIFNNNDTDNGAQIEGLNLTLTRDFYYRIDADNSYQEVTP